MDIKFEVIPYGGGWEDYILTVDGVEAYLLSTCIYDRLYINELLEPLCYLSADYSRVDYTVWNYVDIDMCERPFEIWYREDGSCCVKERDEEDINTENKIVHVSEVPEEVNFKMDAESRIAYWKIVREKTAAREFMLSIDIHCDYDQEKHYHFNVPYRDFCLAVANGCVEALKKYGIFGWSHSSYGQEMVNLRYVIFLKAVGLGREAELMERDKTEEKRGPKTSLKKELEILFA